MLSAQATLLLLLLPLSYAQETVLGVYMFHRHGDRTAKAWPPTNLTALGYQEVYTSGDYYRSRYIASTATYKINGINNDIVKASQIQLSAPSDTVLQDSALGFAQGLYPPVGPTLSSQTLANGTTVTPPMNGYQLIPINIVSTGAGSEDTSWLQDASSCYNAEISSNEYFYSPQYISLLNSTAAFYQGILPVVNGTFTSTTDSFKNAYTIYDLLNVAEIHNATIQSNSLITTDVFHQLKTLADTHEYNLAYNASSTARAVQGMTLAGQVVSFFNTSIKNNGSSKLAVQFGAYGSFQSFFGLADLPTADPMFYGIPDYTSAMTFELFTNESFTGKYPTSTDSLQVRFLWHNGTTSNVSEPVAYPLFGTSDTTMAWADFQTKMNSIGLSTTAAWCTVCGNTTGICASTTTSSSSSPTTSSTSSGSSSTSSSSSMSSSSSGGGMSLAVAGVIGAMVTLGVILLVEGVILLAGGFKLVSKSAAGAATTTAEFPNFPKSA